MECIVGCDPAYEAWMNKSLANDLYMVAQFTQKSWDPRSRIAITI